MIFSHNVKEAATDLNVIFYTYIHDMSSSQTTSVQKVKTNMMDNWETHRYDKNMQTSTPRNPTQDLLAVR